MKIQSLIILIIIFLSVSTCGTDSIINDITEAGYQQNNRPQVHFSPSADWMSSPSSSIFFEDEYHLFYQHSPTSGPNQNKMHWGHAVSSNLTHWEQLAPAITPDEKGEIQPGSVVIDWENTTGFSKTGEPPLVAFFTLQQADKTQSQAIAYSNDKGRTWTKYENNPILQNANYSTFHDPKVIWDSESKQWVMLVATDDRILFYGSSNLIQWKYLSDFGSQKGAHDGTWSNPDFFATTVTETGSKKWILLTSIHDSSPNGGSGNQYFIGEFNGKRFRLDQEFAPFLKNKTTPQKAAWLDYGRDYYSAASIRNIDDRNERQIIFAWMNNWDYAKSTPTLPWQGNATLPKVIDVHNTATGPQIFQSFPHELKSLRKSPIEANLVGVFSGSKTISCSPQQLEVILEASVAQDSATLLSFELHNSQGEKYIFGFDAIERQYFSDRTKARVNSFSDTFAKNIHFAPKQIDGSLISMHFILDLTSCELIADDGLTVMTEQFFPSEPFTDIIFNVTGPSADIQRFEVYELEGIWK